MSSSTFSRISAFIIDMMIISVITLVLTFWIPVSDTYEKAYKEQEELVDLVSQNEITNDEYFTKIFKLRYIMEKESVVNTFVTVIVTLGYFSTFAYYKDGQTFGKKLINTKVVNKDGGNVDHLSMLIRTLLFNGVLTSVISSLLLFLLTENDYMIIYSVSIAQIVFNIICFVMVAVRKDKRGLHDIIAGTKVIAK